MELVIIKMVPIKVTAFWGVTLCRLETKFLRNFYTCPLRVISQYTVILISAFFPF